MERNENGRRWRRKKEIGGKRKKMRVHTQSRQSRYTHQMMDTNEKRHDKQRKIR